MPQSARVRRGAAALVLAVTAALALVAPRPRMDNAAEAWFPTRDPRVVSFREFQAEFGADEVIVAEVAPRVAEGEVTQDDVAAALRLAADVSQRLEGAPGVAQVLSPSSVFSTETALLTDPTLLGMQNLATVGWAFEGPLNRALGLFDPASGRCRVVAMLEPGDLEQLAGVVDALEPARRAAAGGRLALRVAGQPLVNLALDQASREVQRVSMPLLVAACVLVLLVTTRSARLTVALLVSVGLGVLATEGLLGLWGETNLIVAIVSPLMFVLLLACGFHITIAYVDLRRAGRAGEDAAWGAARTKARACCYALLTTGIGFGSLAISDVAPISTFGALSAAGLALGAPLLLLGLPGILALSGGAPAPGTDRLGELCARVVLASHRGWVPTLAVGAALVAGAASASTRLTTQPHAIEYFDPQQPVRADHERMAADGVPLAHLEALVAAPASLTDDPRALERLDAWARASGELAGVRGVLSLPLVLREAGYRAARVDAFPADWLLDDVLQRTRTSWAPFVGRDGRLLRFTVLIDTLGPDELDVLRDALTTSFRDALGDGAGLSLTLTGSYDLLLQTQRSLLNTLRQSLLLTALLMEVVLLVALRSWRLALAALLPNALPPAAVILTLWVTGIPVDVATSMTAAIALGIAVDDTLHFLCAAQGEGLAPAARGTGRAVVLTSLVIGLGFLAVTVSDFVPTRNFGLLCALSMAAALAGDLVLLPAALRLFGAAGPTPSGGPAPRPAGTAS